MSELPIYELERDFKAPRELVFRTWTDPALLARWYGPNVETIIHRLEVAPGGMWLTEMKMGDRSFFQKAEFIDVVPEQRIVCLMSNTDEHWEIAPNPMMPDWPRQLLTTITFADVGDNTRLKLTWVPHEATEAELRCFAEAMSRAGAGWTAGFEKLAELLDELAAERP